MSRRKSFSQAALAALLLFANALPALAETRDAASLCGAELATTGLSNQAIARLQLPDAALSALGRLEMASREWEASVAAFDLSPTDEGTRARYAPYAPFQTMFLAYVDFRSSAEELDDLARWPQEDLNADGLEALKADIEAQLDRARARFEKEWQTLGRRFLDSALATGGKTGAFRPPPIRLRFSDKYVGQFFERCRGDQVESLQRCAGSFSWSRYARIAMKRLELVNESRTLEELRTRTKDLKLYSKGCKYAGYYGIEIDHQYRLLFHWDYETGTAVDVFIEDYHAE